MHSRRRWRQSLLAFCAGGTLFGMSCRDTVREAVFAEAFEFVTGQVNNNLLDAVPVDDILSNILNPPRLSS